MAKKKSKAKKTTARRKSTPKPRPKPRPVFGFHVPATLKEVKLDHIIEPEYYDDD